ncbi:uncharacterized protein LOC135823448 [Sycon ciliatum]|uniref:uncharacterized protein LOC135823448 n=1 Tax=Sycon ciliatum TaxID=27933 RepID=UPI0031F66445
MASPPVDRTPSAEKGPTASVAMRSVMAGIRHSFPTVQQMSTRSLSDRIRPEQAEPNMSRPDVVLLDTRELAEYNVSHLPGAKRLDPSISDSDLASFVDDLRQRQPDAVDKPLDLVCYCSVGYRSSKMASRLQKLLRPPPVARDQASASAGQHSSAQTSAKQSSSSPDCAAATARPVASVFNLEGSMFQWANENRQLCSAGTAATRQVHPYSVVWGRLVDRDRHNWGAS